MQTTTTATPTVEQQLRRVRHTLRGIREEIDNLVACQCDFAEAHGWDHPSVGDADQLISDLEAAFDAKLQERFALDQQVNAAAFRARHTRAS